jgi:hypothetical protein
LRYQAVHQARQRGHGAEYIDYKDYSVIIRSIDYLVTMGVIEQYRLAFLPNVPLVLDPQRGDFASAPSARVIS